MKLNIPLRSCSLYVRQTADTQPRKTAVSVTKSKRYQASEPNVVDCPAKLQRESNVA